MTVIDSYPLSNIDYTTALAAAWNANGSNWGQTFKTPNDAATHTIIRAVFSIWNSASGVGTARVDIYAHTGTYGATGTPTGAILASSDTVNLADMSSSTYTPVAFNFTGANQIALAANTAYCAILILATYTSGQIQVYGDSTTPTHAGNSFSYYNAGWVANAAIDICFYILESPITLTVSAPTGSGSSYPAQGTSSQTIDATLNVYAIPSRGYRLTKWVLDGVNVTNYTRYPVTMTYDRTIAATFGLLYLTNDTRLYTDIKQLVKANLGLANCNVTLTTMSISTTQDTTTGLYNPSIGSGSTIEMVIIPRLNANILLRLEIGTYTTADALGFTTTYIRQRDRITDANLKKYEVARVVPHEVNGKLLFYMAELTEVRLT